MKRSLIRCTWYIIMVSIFITQSNDLISQIPSTKPTFDLDDKTVSTTFFIWYASNGGQLSGPWIPVEGRENWTGTPDWWKTQIKQLMMANIDIMLVHLMHQTDERRTTLFQALYELRLEGYEIPKIAPYLDPVITWGQDREIDMANESAKDEFANQYIRFYNLYFDQNPDEFAEDYLAKMDGKLMLDTWHTFVTVSNIDLLNKSDIESRLADAFPNRPLFANGIYMLAPALNNPIISFSDERIAKFEINEYYVEFNYNNITSATLKAGYWDQNIRNPGDFLPREGGIHFKEAWQTVNEDIDRVYIESWNEYDEGTGIYAGATDGPVISENNTSGNQDNWSSTNDPFEYIRTSAKYSALFNNLPQLDSRIIDHNLPDTVTPGETYEITISIQNLGNQSWTGNDGFNFALSNSSMDLGAVMETIDDENPANEITIYDGIFRGRPVQFNLEINIPALANDSIQTTFSMFSMDEAFGQGLEHTFHIKNLSTNVNRLEASAYSISPNPVNNYLHLDIESGHYRVVIYDLKGTVLSQTILKGSNSIDTTKLKPGAYFLKIMRMDETLAASGFVKFIKQ